MLKLKQRNLRQRGKRYVPTALEQQYLEPELVYSQAENLDESGLDDLEQPGLALAEPVKSEHDQEELRPEGEPVESLHSEDEATEDVEELEEPEEPSSPPIVESRLQRLKRRRAEYLEQKRQEAENPPEPQDVVAPIDEPTDGVGDESQIRQATTPEEPQEVEELEEIDTRQPECLEADNQDLEDPEKDDVQQRKGNDDEDSGALDDVEPTPVYEAEPLANHGTVELNREHFPRRWELGNQKFIDLEALWATDPLEQPQLPCPPCFQPTYVVSIRGGRMNGFVERMGPWMQYMRRFPCTDGRFIPIRVWRRRKKVGLGLTRGQAGCYDSHVRIWKAIADGPHAVATVMEDDVDLRWNDYAKWQRVTEAMAELRAKSVKWDLLSWGHGPWAINKNVPVDGLEHWRRPGYCQGFYIYTITQRAAKRLAAWAGRRYKGPAVDKWVFDQMVPSGKIKALTLEPSLTFVIPGPSETGKMQP